MSDRNPLLSGLNLPIQRKPKRAENFSVSAEVSRLDTLAALLEEGNEDERLMAQTELWQAFNGFRNQS